MNDQILKFFTASGIVLLFIGCAEMPEQKLHNTKIALEEAKKSGAEMYAPSIYKAAEMSFDLAKKAIEAEGKKLPFMRKYEKSTETLKNAMIASESAKMAVDSVKEHIIRETESMAGTIGMLLDSAAFQLKALSKAKKATADSIFIEIDSVTAELVLIKSALSSNELYAAKEKASVVLEKARAISAHAEILKPAKKVIAKKR